ncbi:hypothetical protein BaRGS_00040522 [Batillaria attramentaria]|uniref:Ubiquitin-like protease family profile domain-containing protein n=1 Tax=Batillaria attramentaria TaxID=370345 RepID=A0ABD0IZS5_9CAEN
MRGWEIDRVLRQDVHTNKVFQGVYPRDTLPLTVHLKKPAAFVVNTDRLTGQGEHWVAIYIDEHGRGEYFDSFGLPPTYPELINFLNRHCWYHRHNPQVLQSVTSRVCGMYVVYYIMQKARGQTLWRLLAPFDPRYPWRNDKLVVTYLKQHLKKPVQTRLLG